jgi:hypothetical protein
MKVKSLVAVLCLAVILSGSSLMLFGEPLNNGHGQNLLPLEKLNLYGIVFARGEFYATGDKGIVVVSPDGTNWAWSSTATTNQLNAIIYAQGKWVAAGNSGVLETSADGAHWSLQNSGTTKSLTSLAYGNGTFLAVGPNAVTFSRDAVNWNPTVSGLWGANQVAGGDEGFVAIVGGAHGYSLTNESPQAYFSADGTNWVTNRLPVSPGFNGAPFVPQIVTYANGAFLMGGVVDVASELGDFLILASPDGVHWPTNAAVWDMPPSLGLNFNFFLTGSANVIAGGGIEPFLATSTNGVNWSQSQNNVGYGNAGAYGNGTYVVVKSSQAIYTSPDGVNWSTPQSASPAANVNRMASSHSAYPRAFSNSVVASTNKAVYAAQQKTIGSGSAIAPSAQEHPQFALQIFGQPPQNSFKIFATPGMNYRILASPNLSAAGPWTTVATVTNAAAITYWTNATASGNQCYFRLVSP